MNKDRAKFIGGSACESKQARCFRVAARLWERGSSRLGRLDSNQDRQIQSL